MKVYEGDHRVWEPLPAPAAVTIGVYDGVHLGHQHVLRSLEAFGLPVVVEASGMETDPFHYL